MTTQETKNIISRLNERIHRILLIYYTYKTLSEILNDENERNKKYLSECNCFFQALSLSLQNSFIIEICKFFEKNNKALTLKRLEKKQKNKKKKEQIKELREGIKKEINLFKDVRNDFKAHDNFGTTNFKIKNFYEKSENIISAIIEIFNILASDLDKSSYLYKRVQEQTKEDAKKMFKFYKKGIKNNN